MLGVNDYIPAALKGGVGFESPADVWHILKKGQRALVALTYTTALAASTSYISNSITTQDNSTNNYTELRIFVYNAGSTSLNVKVQGSIDNTNFYDLPNQTLTLTADGAAIADFKVYTPYIRIVEANNDSTNAQTANILYVMLL